MMSRAARAPCCEQDTADGDGRQERPPERYPTRITAIPRDCLIHFLLRPLFCVLRVRADGPEAVTLYLRQARSYGRHRLCDHGVTAGWASLAWEKAMPGD